MDWWAIAATGLLMMGTVVQALLQLVELRVERREVIAEWNAEDELVAELRPWRRRRARRELVAMRTPEMDWAIRHTELVLYGWLVLVAGAALAFVGTLLS